MTREERVFVLEEGNLGTADNPTDLRGLTLRELLKVLRGVAWGDSGTMAPVALSDGSEISVALRTDSDGATGRTAIRERPRCAGRLGLTLKRQIKQASLATKARKYYPLISRPRR